MNSDELVIEQTKKWIADVVIGCNFCPFAAKEFKRNSINYVVVPDGKTASFLEALMKAVMRMDTDRSIETTLLIFPGSVQKFRSYLQLVELSEDLLSGENYDGIYQLASFHPEYIFQGASNTDASNYTNRSPYPMLHLLREESLTAAIDNFPGTEKIPQRNIAFTEEKGLLYMQNLKAACTRDLS